METPISPIDIMQKAFPGLGNHEAQRIVQAGTLMTIDDQTILCHEGAFESTFYIIMQGKVVVTKVINDRETRILKYLSAGDFFGEMALIHDAPRAASVATVAPTVVLALEKDAFSTLLEKSSSISLAMVREVSRRLRENDEMAIEDLRIKARELALAYQQLAELEAARNEFLTTLAHELRTPLMAANGYLQIIQSGRMKDGEISGAVEIIAHHVRDITSVVNDLLFLQEMNLILPDMKPVELASIVQNAARQYQDLARTNNVDLSIIQPEETQIVNASPKNLERAISALIDNAIKFSPLGGRVQIHIESDGSMTRLSITDSGVGIHPEVLPKIFDRFFHTDQIGEHLFRGIGLGLSIAREVIHQHGGKIEVQSTLGNGSTFSILLPAYFVEKNF